MAKLTAEDFYDFYRQKGYPDHVIAGIVGNLYQESNLDTGIRNKTSGAFGLAQWLSPNRVKGLKNYAMELGRSVEDPYVQMGYIDRELQTNEAAAGNALLKAKTPEEAAYIFSTKYERAGKDETNQSRRNRIANTVYKQLSNYGSSSGESSGVEYGGVGDDEYTYVDEQPAVADDEYTYVDEPKVVTASDDEYTYVDEPTKVVNKNVNENNLAVEATAKAGVTPIKQSNVKPTYSNTNYYGTTPSLVDDLISKGKAALTGFGQGASFGFSDEIRGLASGVGGVLDAVDTQPDVRIPLGKNESLMDRFNKEYEFGRNQQRDVIEQDKKVESDYINPYTFGELAGGITTPISSLKIPNLIKPGYQVESKLLNKIPFSKDVINWSADRARSILNTTQNPLIGGAAIGGLTGAGYSTDDQKLSNDVMMGVGLGALGGSALGFGSQLLNPIARKMNKDSINDFVTSLTYPVENTALFKDTTIKNMENISNKIIRNYPEEPLQLTDKTNLFTKKVLNFNRDKKILEPLLTKFNIKGNSVSISEIEEAIQTTNNLIERTNSGKYRDALINLNDDLLRRKDDIFKRIKNDPNTYSNINVNEIERYRDGPGSLQSRLNKIKQQEGFTEAIKDAQDTIYDKYDLNKIIDYVNESNKIYNSGLAGYKTGGNTKTVTSGINTLSKIDTLENPYYKISNIFDILKSGVTTPPIVKALRNEDYLKNLALKNVKGKKADLDTKLNDVLQDPNINSSDYIKLKKRLDNLYKKI